MATVSSGLAFFYFPVASLLRLILEIKDFLPLFTWFIFQGQQPLGLFFWSEKRVGWDLGVRELLQSSPYSLILYSSSGRLRSGNF